VCVCVCACACVRVCVCVCVCLCVSGLLQLSPKTSTIGPNSELFWEASEVCRLPNC